MLVLCVTLSFCKKATTALPATSTLKDSTTTLPPVVAFKPYTDTFVGVVSDVILDGWMGFRKDSSKTSTLYLYHYNSNAAAVSGDQIYTYQYDYQLTNVTFATNSFSLWVNLDSPSHIGDAVTLRNDSILIAIHASYHCSEFDEYKRFAGKKKQ